MSFFKSRYDDCRIIAQHSRMPHYQAYYWLALSSSGYLSVKKAAWWYKVLPSSILALDFEALLEQIRPRLGLDRCWNSSDLSDFVGCYTLQHNGKNINFAIDAHDLKDIVSPKALDWCDIYFKANKWTRKKYADKVVPIVNGNGFLRDRHLAGLRKLRNAPKKNDLVFISRIWGGIEHNVRLFKELAKIPGKKYLVAIFVHGTGSSVETEAAIKRLEKVGVECTYDLISIRKLWKEMASAKIVILRAGKHMCIPWRMIDLLCMGSCIFTDSDFYPDWPKRLQPGKHYISAGISRPADTSPASVGEFGKVLETLVPLLKDDRKQKSLRENSAAYYDNFAAPEKVSNFILSQLTQL